MSDSDGMDCQQFREAVSAHLDGERAGTPREVVADHLAGCAPCRAFAGSAERIGRLARVRPAAPVPDVTGAVFAALGLVGPAADPAAGVEVGFAGGPAADAAAEAAGSGPAAARRPELVSIPGCCGPTGCEVVDGAVGSALLVAPGAGSCGCAASCGCGCQQGAPCRCGTKAA